MENLDTESKVRDWLPNYLPDYYQEYLSPRHEYKHSGDTWIVSHPPVDDPRDILVGGPMQMLIADDGSMIRVVTNALFIEPRQEGEGTRDLWEMISYGSWRTSSHLAQIYPEVKRPSLEEIFANDLEWLDNYKRKNAEKDQ